jgi:hypothetical protein
MLSGRGFLVGLTQWLNATLSGDPDMPLSTRSAIEAATGKRRWVIIEAFIDLLFAIVTGERDHCRNSLAGNSGDTISGGGHP